MRTDSYKTLNKINKNNLKMCEKDLFKEDFRYYKRRNPPPNLTSVIDFDSSHKPDIVIDAKERYLNATSNNTSCETCKKLGLQNHSNWNIFSIKSLIGFIYIKNPFLPTGQQMWIKECLKKYPRKPSITNLDIHYKNVDDIWSLRNHTDQEKKSYILKLCWATLGYHHNWNTKLYNPNHRSEFPNCLQELSKHIAHCLGFATYQPEAAIVNYYNLKSTLSIHNDHSEEDVTAPIISFSFGQSGIFLIGTENKTEKPSAMFLRSGDVIVMSGDCRFSYHAVPCILSDNVCDRYFNAESDSDWLQFNEYIKQARINISVRQVYKNGS